MKALQKNKLRQHTLKLWNEYKFILAKYDINKIFIGDDIREDVLDDEIKQFLEGIIYKMIPNITKKKFETSDNEIRFIKEKVTFDVDGFMEEKYIVRSVSKITIKKNKEELETKTLSPLEKRYDILDEKESKSNYQKLFGHSLSAEKLSNLMTAIQSTQISQGIALEEIIYQEYLGYKEENIKINNALSIIKNNSNKDILFRKIILDSEFLNERGVKYDRQENLHVDFIFYSKNKVYIREVKDGNNLDTKKSDAEVSEMKMLKDLFPTIINVEAESGIVSWISKNKKDVSFKAKDIDEYIELGPDFAKLLNVNYQKIVDMRMKINEGNLEYALNKMLEILEFENLI